jgi:hypothetical protein
MALTTRTQGPIELRGRTRTGLMPTTMDTGANESDMMTWEYVIERASVVERWGPKRQAEEVAAFQKKLNEYGTDGWEMVGFETVPLTGAFSGNVKGYVYLVFFKRPTS